MGFDWGFRFWVLGSGAYWYIYTDVGDIIESQTSDAATARLSIMRKATATF